MLQVTESAANVIKAIRERDEVSEEMAVRVQSMGQGDDGRERVGLSWADEPAEGDAVSDQIGVRVFVEDSLTDHLDDAVLDARESEEGGVELVVRV